MSAQDTVYGFFPDTIPAELPAVVSPLNYDAYDYGYSGTSSQPNIAEIPRSEAGISFTGVLNAASAAANTGLNIWKGVQQLNMSARTQQAQNEIARLQLDVNKETALGTLDLNRAQLTAKKEVGIIEARSSIAQARDAAIDARGGTFTASKLSSNLIVLLGVGALIYLSSQKGGAK